MFDKGFQQAPHGPTGLGFRESVNEGDAVVAGGPDLGAMGIRPRETRDRLRVIGFSRVLRHVVIHESCSTYRGSGVSTSCDPAGKLPG